jgi:hypothetical protein
MDKEGLVLRIKRRRPITAGQTMDVKYAINPEKDLAIFSDSWTDKQGEVTAGDVMAPRAADTAKVGL